MSDPSYPQTPDVAVIGGGVVGVCVARELARRGAAVTILERAPELGAGCSAGNAGIVGPSHVAPLAEPAALRDGLRWMGRPDSPLYLPPRPATLPWIARFVRSASPARAEAARGVMRALGRASATMHEQLHAAGLDTGYRRAGMINVFAEPAAFAAAAKAAEQDRRDGIDAIALHGAAVQGVCPRLIGDPAGAVLYPDDAHCDPLRFVQAVGADAQAHGARVRTGVEVLALTRTGSRVSALQTTAGEIRAEQVVLATGAWAPGLARDVSLALPIEGGKGYHVDLGIDPGAELERPVWFHESRVVATPLDGRLRLAGTLELAGLDLTVDLRRVDAIVRAAARGLAGLDQRRVIQVWRGLRPCSPDGVPIIGRTEAADNLLLAGGHGMWGLQLGPLTGEVIADLACGRDPAYDIAPLSPDRFRGLAWWGRQAAAGAA